MLHDEPSHSACAEEPRAQPGRAPVYSCDNYAVGMPRGFPMLAAAEPPLCRMGREIHPPCPFAVDPIVPARLPMSDFA
jgi:hypothetical protein